MTQKRKLAGQNYFLCYSFFFDCWRHRKVVCNSMMLLFIWKRTRVINVLNLTYLIGFKNDCSWQKCSGKFYYEQLYWKDHFIVLHLIELQFPVCKYDVSKNSFFILFFVGKFSEKVTFSRFTKLINMRNFVEESFLLWVIIKKLLLFLNRKLINLQISIMYKKGIYKNYQIIFERSQFKKN